MTKSEAREIIQRKCVLGSPNDPHRLIFDAGPKLRRRTGYVKLRQCNMYCLTGLKRGRDRDSRGTQGSKSGGAPLMLIIFYGVSYFYYEHAATFSNVNFQDGDCPP